MFSATTLASLSRPVQYHCHPFCQCDIVTLHRRDPPLAGGRHHQLDRQCISLFNDTSTLAQIAQHCQSCAKGVVNETGAAIVTTIARFRPSFSPVLSYLTLQCNVSTLSNVAFLGLLSLIISGERKGESWGQEGSHLSMAQQ